MLGPGESILKDSMQDFVTAGDSGGDVVLVMVVTAGDSGGDVVLVMVVVVEVIVVVMVDGNTFCICRLDFTKLFQ